MKNISYRITGLMLLFFSGLVWAWMFGAFSPLAALDVGTSAAQWLAPGFLSMPATIAVIIGIVGILFLFGLIPMSTDEK